MTIIQLPMFLYALAKNFVEYILMLGICCKSYFLLINFSLAVIFQRYLYLSNLVIDYENLYAVSPIFIFLHVVVSEWLLFYSLPSTEAYIYRVQRNKEKEIAVPSILYNQMLEHEQTWVHFYFSFLVVVAHFTVR